ncbi:MAG: CDP-2,3-bis-(O-geranylgeranyl)-sn-glycerol synthase [Candidatus Micrarchaeia archaeon]
MLENLLHDILSIDVVWLILLVLPAYVANSTPTIFGGGMPMDFGRNFFDGNRILGDGKTWRGFAFGLSAGILTAILEQVFLGGIFLWSGCVLSLGAVCGDVIGSFIKRRMNYKRGAPVPILDQLTFIFFSIILLYPFIPLSWASIVFLLLLTYILHVLTNIFANKIGIKKVPW